VAATFDGSGETVALFSSQIGDTTLYGSVDVADVSTGRLLGTLNEAVSRGYFVDSDHLLMSSNMPQAVVLWTWVGKSVRTWMPLDPFDQLATLNPLDRDSALAGVTRADGRPEVVRIPLGGQELARLACQVAGRDLTAAEKARYLKGKSRTTACTSR
jgi:hypothetical protein